MHQFTDQLDETQKAFLLSDEPYPFAEALLKHLKKYAVDVTYKSKLPKKLTKKIFADYSYIIFIKKRVTKEDLAVFTALKTPTLVITENTTLYNNLVKTFPQSSKKTTHDHLKFAHLDLDDTESETIENLVWFFLGRKNEKSIDLAKSVKPSKKKEQKSFAENFQAFRKFMQLSKRKKWALAICILLFVQFFFVLPLLGTGYFIYRSAENLQNGDVEKAQSNIDIAKPMYQVTKDSYRVSRPLFLLFFLSLVPENAMNIEENAITFIQTAIDTHTQTQSLGSLVLKTGKTADEINEVKISLSQLNTHIDTLTETSGNLRELLDYRFEKTQELRDQFGEVNDQLKTLGTLVKHSDDLLDGNQKYLLFFYNNMEQRPGGGFIGSFATVTFDNYTLEDFEVYDVYDADGQLKGHVPPPRPIREHLDQPNWFLRDSNFSEDFAENVKSAEFFLEKELNLGDFDHYVGITTTGLTYILEAFGELSVPDFNETITADNFYMKAQLQSEGDFFPGSTQKKSYLSTVGRTILFSIEDASPVALGTSIKKAFDEKQLLFLSKNQTIQSDIDGLRWSGKTSLPQCLAGPGACIVNHVYSIDANLGVNKANYYVNKTVQMRTDIDEDGNITNILATTMINNSPSEVFPGGTYKNYYQVYVPSASDVTTVDIDGQVIRTFDEKSTGYFKVIGVLVEVPPKGTKTVTVEYELADPLPTGNKSYQLVVQKQIGSFNYDFGFEINLPDNIIVSDQNFPSLANSGSVVYNTDLSTDRIFVIDLVRE